jgi:hypothetical protein
LISIAAPAALRPSQRDTHGRAVLLFCAKELLAGASRH